MPLTYQQYLKLDELLELQVPLSAGPEHDELLFITTHQVYELWFKQILHELGLVITALRSNDNANVFHGLKRTLAILKTLVSQIDILETMTPVSFNSFRDRLEAASGLQSAQFRELEFILGKRDPQVIARYAQFPAAQQRLEQRFHAPGIWDAFLRFLTQNGVTVPQTVLERDVTLPIEACDELQAVLVDIYRARSTLMQVCERLVDLDEGLQEWRYRHIKMVERTIGAKFGTGGSAGAAYLKNTLFKPLFPDLWAIRNRL